MGKGNRLRKERKSGNSINESKPYFKDSLTDSVTRNDLLLNHSYWVTGYFWRHDVIFVEPFCVVKTTPDTFTITNLKTLSIDMYEAKTLLSEGNAFFYTDRYTALRVYEALCQEKDKLDALKNVLPDEAMKLIGQQNYV